MMRRGRKKLQGAAAAPWLAIPKSRTGKSARQEKDARDRAATVQRAAVRAYVRIRDGWCRARCQNADAAVWAVAHVHEEPPRSQGGDDTNPRMCLWLCPTCHADRHPKLRGGGPQRLFPRPLDPVAGTDGPVEFLRRFPDGGSISWVTEPVAWPSWPTSAP
jgi:hypothetical protein